DPAISLEAQVLPFDQISHNIGLGEQGNFDSGEGGLLCIVNCQAKEWMDLALWAFERLLEGRVLLVLCNAGQ
ncbi:unnamed protein product, partial [Effrenium voratum]